MLEHLVELASIEILETVEKFKYIKTSQGILDEFKNMFLSGRHRSPLVIRRCGGRDFEPK